MRLRGVALPLLVLFLLAKVDASANTTASATILGTYPSTRDRPSTLISWPSSAGDEERVDGTKAFGWGDNVANLLTKSKQTLRKTINDSLLKLRVAWWWVRNADPHVVYVELKLDQVNTDILSNPNFHAWVKYVDSYNLEHPLKRVSTLTKLVGQYGTYQVAIMLEQATRGADKSTQAIGTTLQAEQMSLWRQKDIAADRLYDLLQSSENKANQVDKHKPRLLTGPALNLWNIYARKYNPGKPTTLFKELYHTVDDARLSLLLIAAKQSTKTKALATDLQTQLRNVWLNKKVDPKVVFTYLRLNKSPKKGLLDQPEMKVWMRYAKLYWGKTKKDVTLNEVIKSVYNANEIKIIVNSATTDYGKYLARKLANAQA